MSLFILAAELIGTVAFSISGALLGMKKDMDLFGIVILGLATAVGGGVLRDLMIGVTPPQCFRDPIYLIVATAAAVLFFLPAIRTPLLSRSPGFDTVLFLMDAIGLAVFTITGIQTAQQVSTSFGTFLLVFVGLLTGTGGGVLRDLFAGYRPYIFVKHVYATAALIGALFYLAAQHWYNGPATAVAAMALIFLIRCLSAKFKWNLPKAGLPGQDKP